MTSERLLAALLLLAAARLEAANFTVTNTNDSGAGSLRQAVIDANANGGVDTIDFAIAGSGVHTIVVSSPFPHITSPVTIDGYTQPGSSANTNGPGLPDNSVHLIEIDGTGCAGAFVSALLDFDLGSAGSTVRGLVINRCGVNAIRFGNTGGGNHLEGSYLGTDPSGTVSHGNGGGIAIDNSGFGESNDVIGGTAPAARNLISGNGSAIAIVGGSGHLVAGNFMGTDKSGAAPLPNGTGVFLSNDGAVTIGGTTANARNVISGNTNSGIQVGSGFPSGVNGLQVQGNYIGTDLTGVTALPNGGNGITHNQGSNSVGGSAAGAGNVISGNAGSGIATGSGLTVQGNRIGVNVSGSPLGNKGPGIVVFGSGVILGGTTAGEGNEIAYNGSTASNGTGVLIDGGGRTQVAVRGNSIYANTSTGALANRGLGIDLNNDGPTPNDVGDADGGDNNSQNHPLLISAAPNGAGGTHVTGVLDSEPGTLYGLDFYADPGCASRPHDFFEARVYLGSTNVTTDGSGHATFDLDLAVPIQTGDPVTATATDPGGNTSELSPRLPFSISPASGAAAGGTSVTVTGTGFATGAALTIGGQPAGSVVVTDSTHLSATAPGRPAGSVNDVTVTNLDGTTGTLVKGWAADFLDVPGSNPFNAFVARLVLNAITAGCGGGNYCPNSSVTRAQMSVFLLRGKNGLCYFPPAATGTVFNDVPANSFAAAYIEALAAAAITGGCGGGNYCPGDPVTRAQMAVFLLRTLEGMAYVPPACVTPTFGDVPCSSGFARWIEELVRRGITAGCGGGNYCPGSSVTRGQMAVFISTTFMLP